MKGCLTAYYQNFLECEPLLHLENVPLAKKEWMWIQHVGVPPLFGRGVIWAPEWKLSRKTNGNIWTDDAASSVAQFKFVHFFLWDCMKSRVYTLCNKNQSLEFLEVPNCKRHKHSTGFIIQVIHSLLVSVNMLFLSTIH